MCNRLQLISCSGYSQATSAKSEVRGDSLNIRADISRIMRFFWVRSYVSMVGRSGGAYALAGFSDTGLSTPLRLITTFDSVAVRLQNLIREAVTMTTTLTPRLFRFLFLAVKRTDNTDRPHKIETIATDERTARLILARDYILAFAGRVPAQEVAHG